MWPLKGAMPNIITSSVIANKMAFLDGNEISIGYPRNIFRVLVIF